VNEVWNKREKKKTRRKRVLVMSFFIFAPYYSDKALL